MYSHLLRISPFVFSLLAATIWTAKPAIAENTDGTSFVDEFETLNAARWYVSDGWTNGDHQNCAWSRQEVTVRDGRLLVGFSPAPALDRLYRCGEVQTKASFGYGTYEARLRTPNGSGLNANIFTYIGPAQGKPHDEIDFEFLLRDTRRVQLNVFKNGKGGNEHLAPLPAPSNDSFMNYAFVWEPNRIRWFIEGREVHRIENPDLLPTNNAKIYLSLWGTDTLTDWLGQFIAPAGPIAMEVERVAFTRLGEPCQFLGSVACDIGN